MIYKPAKLTFDVNSRTSPSVKTDIQFITQDLNTARLDFALTKDGVPLPLSAVVGKLVLVMSNGSKFVRNITLVDKPEGRAEYVLSADEIRHYGNVKAELLMYYTNGQALSIHRFEFKIDRSLIDQDIAPIAEYYIEDFETLKTQIEDLYDDVVATVAELEEKFEGLDNVETKDGAQAKVDAHANNSDVHVTKAQKTAWDAKETPAGAQAKVTEHANNLTMHVTSEERASWNGRETTAGAQAKVNTHEAKTSIHVTDAEKSKWNGGQLTKITADDGKAYQRINATDPSYLERLLTLPGVHSWYVHEAHPDMPVKSSMRALSVFSENTYGWVIGANNRGEMYYNRSTTNTAGTAQEWGGWKRLLTDADASTVTWKTPTLSNGWKQYVAPDGSSHTIRYSKDAFGVVEIVGAIYGGAIGSVPAFTLDEGYTPIQQTYFSGVASSVGTPGVPQTHRTLIGTDGKVVIQSCSNSANPNEFITFGIRFKAK
ncbi:phage baseplate upper protein [Bacillus altitudinis]|uniref:phage baseplate upper protein n=1 Tax=Bacillus altitudinis TaxID=293387 RepID=UPI002282FDEE|nr:phage baseplate upper protein [Bacillus altitudinis]MCY7439453.1 phage baseplate upper protein [Bacillus altitudinis]MEC1142490.1 phage baseplate upper protein [Bacillus altitudinis]